MTMTEAKMKYLKNLYQYQKEAAMVRRFPFIWRRLSFIKDDWWLELFLSDVNNAKILWLYTIFMDNNLFELVMDQVVSKKLKSWMYELYKSDIIQLFEKLDPYEPSISHQTDKTRAKLCQVILKILKETWILNNDRLNSVFVPIKVRNYLDQKEKWKEFLYIIS